METFHDGGFLGISRFSVTPHGVSMASPGCASRISHLRLTRSPAALASWRLLPSNLSLALALPTIFLSLLHVPD